MRPNDDATAIVAVFVIVAVVVLATRVWPVTRARRPIRFATLLLVESVVVGAALLWGNVAGDFYGSWAEIFGGDAPVAHITTASGLPVRLSADPIETRTVEEVAIDRDTAHDSRVVSVDITGARTDYTLPARVYLPGSYDQPSQAHRRYPVVEVFDGYPGTPQTWLVAIGLKSILDTEIAAGRVPAMIVVLPSQNPASPFDSECVDAAPGTTPGTQAATYLGVDVPDYVGAHYRVRDSRTAWADMGYSTGGYCAANIALHFPDRYSAAVCLSGYYSPITDRTTGDPYAGDPGLRQANTPLRLLHRHHRPALDFFDFYATDSPRDTVQARELSHAVHAPDELTMADTPSGGHTFRAWKPGAALALDWLATKLT